MEYQNHKGSNGFKHNIDHITILTGKTESDGICLRLFPEFQRNTENARCVTCV